MRVSDEFGDVYAKMLVKYHGELTANICISV